MSPEAKTFTKLSCGSFFKNADEVRDLPKSLFQPCGEVCNLLNQIQTDKAEVEKKSRDQAFEEMKKKLKKLKQDAAEKNLDLLSLNRFLAKILQWTTPHSETVIVDYLILI